MTDNSARPNNSVVIICSTIVILVILAVFTIIILQGKDPGLLLPLIVGVAGAVPGTAAWKNSQEIRRQTNGPLTAGLQTVDDMGARVSSVEATVNNLSNDMAVTMKRVNDFLTSQGH